MRGSVLILHLLLLLHAAAAAGQPRFERRIEPAKQGANRLDVDAALVAGSSARLQDLRLIAQDGREIAYLLVPPRSGEARWTAGVILPIAPSKTTSGVEVDLGASLVIDAVRISSLAAPFLKHVRIEGSGDRSRWTTLADTTVFDLPEKDMQRTEVEIAPGSFRYLRLIWDDRSSARVGRPEVSARVHRSGSPQARLRAPLPFERRPSEPQVSRFHVTLPAAGLPLEAIEIAVQGGSVFRDVTITEPRFTGGEIVPVEVGRGRLKRATQNGSAAEEMSVAVRGIEGHEIDIAVQDGDGGVLPVTGIVARFAPQPWIYFESPDGAPLTARYGDPRLEAPRYDLEAEREGVQKLERLPAARWTEGPKRSTSRISAPSFAPPAGASLDTAAFRVARELRQQDAGLAVLTLDGSALAGTRGLADIRLVDQSGRQVPYIIERREEPFVTRLRVSPRRSEGASSIHPVELPYDRLPDRARIVLRTSGNVFRRTISLRSPSPDRDGPVAFAAAAWAAAHPEVEPPPLTLDLPGTPGRTIEVVVDDGDNAPLPIESAELLFPSYALRFHHPGGRLALLYGNDSVQAPRYDLELLADRLRSEKASEASFAGPAPAPVADEPSRDRTIFWIAIGGALVVLLVVLAKLLRT